MLKKYDVALETEKSQPKERKMKQLRINSIVIPQLVDNMLL